MADTDTNVAETVAPQAPSNEPSKTAAPATDNSSADVEAAKREAEQARMRTNQLENELKKVRDAQDAERQKQLEEQNEYKTLFEKTQEELKTLKDTQEADARRAELSKSTEDIFKNYPAEVVDLAKTAGLSLADDSEASQATLKEKLDAFKAKVAPGENVSSSNPNPSAPVETGQTSGLGRPRSLGVDTGQVTINPEPSKAKVHEYMDNLQSIKQMKLDSGYYREA